MQSKPKYKVCRRLGPGVYDVCQSDTYVLAEARKAEKRGRGMRRRRNVSDYKQQLLEKQKLRFSYGVTEKQFRKYVNAALRSRDGEVGKKLLELLEARLDNVIYRLGLAPTRRAARQLVAHGHVVVNGRKTKVPSYTVQKETVVGIREGSRDKPVFENRKEEMEKQQVPTWVAYDPKIYEAKLKSAPIVDDVLVGYDVATVIEFYSR